MDDMQGEGFESSFTNTYFEISGDEGDYNDDVWDRDETEVSRHVLGVPENEGDLEPFDETLYMISDVLDNKGGYNGKCQRFTMPKDFATDSLKSGMLFISNGEFREAIKRLAAQDSADFWYMHNKEKVTVYCLKRCDCQMKNGRKVCKCGSVKCGFQACGRKYSSDGTFQLKTYVPKHDCGRVRKITKLNSDWLAERYFENFKGDPSWKLTAFMSAVVKDYGIDISYWQAWRAKVRIMLMIYGEAKDQYAKVWDYAKTLIQCRGTSAVIKASNPDKPIFQRLYVCLHACKLGFLGGCRPIVGLDGCHLRDLYIGQILTAVSQDGNNNIFPIAFAVVESETKETWTWFLDNLMVDIGDAIPTFISDRQKSLKEALHKHSDYSRNRICVRHLYENFKKQWPGEAMKDALWTTARALTNGKFDKAMDFIKKQDEHAFMYLTNLNIKPSQWSRHAFNPAIKNDMLLNNMCESFNSIILPARAMPILSLAGWIRLAMMMRFISRRALMDKHQGALTPNVTKLIESIRKESIHCREQWDGGHCYEVYYHTKRYVVGIEKKTCTCVKWQLTGIPCCHVMRCISTDRVSVENFVDKYYSKDMYLSAYALSVQCMPDFNELVTSGYPAPLLPKYVVQLGRPKKNSRKRGEGEEVPSKTKRIRVSQNKCSNCREMGHNKKSSQNATKMHETRAPKPAGRRADPNTVHKLAKQKKGEKG